MKDSKWLRPLFKFNLLETVLESSGFSVDFHTF